MQRPTVAAALIALAFLSTSARADEPSKLGAAGVPPPVAQSAGKPARATLQALTGVWVEGGGYDITYGGTYETCAQRCVGTTRCVMIEYYRPEKKCNLYDRERPRKQGGSSIVGIRQTTAADRPLK
jgi:PAN domain